MTNGQQLHVGGLRSAFSIERLARWWTSASQAERFALIRAAIHGDPEAPPLREVQLAIYLAETANGEVAQA